jgi:hypothetical protein
MPKNLYNSQKVVSAAIRLTERTWLAPTVSPPPDHFMTRLLLSVYAAFIGAKPLYKKTAWMQTGLEDIKTGHKYIARAEQMGLIELARSTEDRRRELIYPTDKLQRLMEVELKRFASDIRLMAAELRETPDLPRVSLAESFKPTLASGQRECVQCHEIIDLPEWSEYLDKRRVRHLWECLACGHRFETLVSLREERKGPASRTTKRTKETSKHSSPKNTNIRSN